jgi:hypothetical protein
LEAKLIDLIRFAWTKTKQILIPFEFKRWLKILAIVWLSGQAASTWLGNFNPPVASTSTQQEEAATDLADEIQAPAGPIERLLDDVTGIPQGTPSAHVQGQGTVDFDSAIEEGTEDEVPSALFFVLIPIVFFVAVLYMWLSARFNFVLLDFLLISDPAIVRSFRQHKLRGNSYFYFLLGMTLVVGVTLLLIVLPIQWVPVLAWVLIPLIIILGIGAVFFTELLKDFILPMMYKDEMGCMETCRKFFSMKPEIRTIAIYFLVKIGLGFLSGLVVFLALLLLGLVAAIVGLIAIFVGGLIGSVIPFLQSLLVILGALFAVILFAGLFFGFAMMTLPIAIFFRIFSLTYLSHLFPDYNLLDFSPYGNTD